MSNSVCQYNYVKFVKQKTIRNMLSLSVYAIAHQRTSLACLDQKSPTAMKLCCNQQAKHLLFMIIQEKKCPFFTFQGILFKLR